MATPDGRTPKTRGSHFGSGDATARQETTNRPDVQAPVPTMQASAPRPAMGGRRVSSRTAAATRRAGAHHVQRESRSGGRNLAPFLVLGLVAIAAVLAIVLVVVPAITGGNGGGETQEVVPGTTVSVTVPEGSGAAAVADALYEAGVIADKSEFLSQVRRMNAEQSIKSGSYSFRTGDDTANIIQTLTTGPNAEISLTIPEGYTVASIAAAVEQTLSIPADDFLAQAKASNYVADYPFLEGVGNTKVEMVVTIIANLANIGFNWVFIYGNLGFTEMGAEGAGLGTLLSRILAPVLMIAYFYRQHRYRIYLTGFSPRNYSWRAVRDLLRMGLPISLQMFLESSAFVGTGIMMGWLGKVAMSANQIATTLGNCAFMIVMSIGAATTIRVSHCYGARNIGELSLAARASIHLVLAWNAFSALVFISLRHFIPTLFTSNAEVIAITSQLLVFAALYQLSDGLQNVSIGILRGIQDVRVIMPIAFVAYWLLNLPVGYLFGFTLGMGPAGLYLGFTFGLSMAALLLILRIRRSVRRLYATN